MEVNGDMERGKILESDLCQLYPLHAFIHGQIT